MADTNEYAATFDLVDSDDDQRISAGELSRLMEVLGSPITAEQAEAAVRADPFVQALLRDFGGTLIPGSIVPLSPSPQAGA